MSGEAGCMSLSVAAVPDAAAKGAKVARSARRDILKQIDSDLLAVEEALNRRRQSLAEIDRKLSELQLPESNIGGIASGGLEGPSVLTSPSVGNGQTTLRAPGGQGTFSEWLQEHKDFCTGIQHARKDQESQEKNWQQRRELLQSQLGLLQSQLQTSCRAVPSTPPASSPAVASSNPLSARWLRRHSGRSVNVPVRAALQPTFVRRAHSWSVPPLCQLETGTNVRPYPWPQSARGPPPPLPGQRQSIARVASRRPASATVPSAHIPSSCASLSCSGRDSRGATPPPRLRSLSEPRGHESSLEDLLLTRSSVATHSARSSAPALAQSKLSQGSGLLPLFRVPRKSFSAVLPLSSPGLSSTAAALTARSATPDASCRAVRARTVSPSRQASPAQSARVLVAPVFKPVPVILVPVPGDPGSRKDAGSAQLSLAIPRAGGATVPVVSMPLVSKASVAPKSALPKSASLPSMAVSRGVPHAAASDNVDGALAPPIGLPKPVLNVPMPPLLQDPLPQVPPYTMQVVSSGVAAASGPDSRARSPSPMPHHIALLQRAPINVPSLPTHVLGAERQGSVAPKKIPTLHQHAATAPQQLPVQQVQGAALSGPTAPQRVTMAPHHVSAVSRNAPVASQQWPGSPEQIPASSQRTSAAPGMMSFDIAKSPTMQVASSFSEAPPPPPPPPPPQQNSSFESHLPRVKSCLVAPQGAAAAPSMMDGTSGHSANGSLNVAGSQVPKPRTASFQLIPNATAGSMRVDCPKSDASYAGGVGTAPLTTHGTVPSPPPPPPPGRGSGAPGDFPVVRAPSSFSSSFYPQSFSEVNLGSFAEGLEQWKPPPSIGSFQVRTEAAFAPIAAPRIEGPNATYTGPQPLPRGQPQCPVQ